MYPLHSCLVKTCKDRRTKRQSLPNPKYNPNIFKKWLLLSGREDLLKRDWQRVHINYRICRSHFSPANFYPNCEKLLKTACPDMNLPDISSTVIEEIKATVSIDLPTTSNFHSCIEESEIWRALSPALQIDDFIDSTTPCATTAVNTSSNPLSPRASALKSVALTPNEPLKETSNPLLTSPILLKALQKHSIQAEESNSAQNDECSVVEILQSPRETPRSEKQNATPNKIKEVFSMKPKGPPKEISSTLQTITRPPWAFRTYSKKKDECISFGTFNENIGDHDNLNPVFNRMTMNPENESFSNNMQEASALKSVALPSNEPLKETSTSLSTSSRLLKALQKHSIQEASALKSVALSSNEPLKETSTPLSASPRLLKAHKTQVEESNSAQNDEWSLVKILQSSRETPLSKKQNATPNDDIIDISEDEPGELLPNEPLEKATTPLSTPLRLTKAQKTHTIKVLGDKVIDDPTVIKSLLGKVKLKKKGTVYIVPLKGKVENKDITASKLNKIIKDNTTGLNRKQLMKVVHRLKTTGEIPTKRRKPRLRNKRPLVKNCTCRIHCLRRGRLAPTVVTSGIATRLEGNALMSDEEVLDPSSYQNLFNVSTILTNVCDKSQIEQLCQLVIESVFRLKNENKNRSMGTLTVYLGQNLAEVQNDFISENDVEPRNQVNSSFTINHGFDVFPFCERENTETLITNEDISYNSIPNNNSMDKKNVKVNLHTFHDHNYLALESKILFQKPEYLVNLINVSTYTSSRKKSRILNFTPKQSEKLFAECKKLKKQNERLREMLKKKTLKIKSLNIEIKRLKNLLTKEQRAQLMKDRKASSDFNVIAVPANSILEIDNFQNSTAIRKKRSRKKKNVEVESDVTNNLPSEVNHENSTPAKKKNEFLSNNYFELDEYSLQITPNPTPVKRKKNNSRKRKSKDILTNPVLNNDTLTSEISNVLEDNDEFSLYKELYESMIINECI